MATQPAARLTEEAYLAIDRAAEYKCEFVDGEIYAMSGGSYRHSDIAGAINAEFRLKLKGRKPTKIDGVDPKLEFILGQTFEQRVINPF